MPVLEQKLEVTRHEMVELLNEDLAREYQAIISYVVYSQMLKGAAFGKIAEELESHAHEELEHAIKLARQIDYLGGTPAIKPMPVKLSHDAEAMLRFDMENERETIGHYAQRIRQADAMGEFALGKVLREIVAQEQDHLIDLASALGVEVPHGDEQMESRFEM
jgi:bacterioferritin